MSETQRAFFHLRSYEAFVIYTFLNLCLGYVGGAGEVEVKMNGFVLQPSVMACTCCLKPMVCRKILVLGSDWLPACSGLEPLVSRSLKILCARRRCWHDQLVSVTRMRCLMYLLGCARTMGTAAFRGSL